jgi:hypothetical protein
MCKAYNWLWAPYDRGPSHAGGSRWKEAVWWHTLQQGQVELQGVELLHACPPHPLTCGHKAEQQLLPALNKEAHTIDMHTGIYNLPDTSMLTAPP